MTDSHLLGALAVLCVIAVVYYLMVWRRGW